MDISEKGKGENRQTERQLVKKEWTKKTIKLIKRQQNWNIEKTLEISYRWKIMSEQKWNNW